MKVSITICESSALKIWIWKRKSFRSPGEGNSFNSSADWKRQTASNQSVFEREKVIQIQILIIYSWANDDRLPDRR